MTQVLDDTARWADSNDPPVGGHPGHLEGGREMAWELAAQLNQALKAHRSEIDRLRAYCCPQCGHPAAVALYDSQEIPV